MGKKLNNDLRDTIKAQYLAGVAASQIAEETGVKLFSIKRMAERGQWGLLRKETEQVAKKQLIDHVAELKVKTIEIVDPIIEKLIIKTHELLDGPKANEMTPKDVLNALEPLVRVRSRILGEITQKHEVNTSTASFLKIVEAANQMSKVETNHLKNSIETRFKLID